MTNQITPNFRSRTISVVKDLTLDEQLYLYQKTKELKEAIRNKDDLSQFRISDPYTGIYIIFLEDSTRTKESFKNAAAFHDTRLTIMNPDSSSFNKSESYTDTFQMLCGYNEYSLFIIRTKLEGVCRWLDQSLGEYAERNKIIKPAFINGGDGKHEHPTQEFLDEFTFFEQKQWCRDHIHIALLGDLYHSRTVHSKADGLKIFKEVKVDLIAPEELTMPAQYVEKMKNNGFEVRRFSCIKEYLSQKDIAETWYFTRLQLERMGEDIREKATYLREAVTFTREYLAFIPEGVRFYHPLPRHRVTPTIPTFLDNTVLNGWEQQALNGYFTRLIEIGMLGGKIGKDFQGEHPQIPSYRNDFVEELPTLPHERNEFKVGIKRIENGIVIDHIGRGDDAETIWEHINKTRMVLDLNVPHAQGVFPSRKTNILKGIISIPNLLDLDERNIKKLGALAPESSINFVTNGRITRKVKLHMPPRVYNFSGLNCNNPDCISHSSHNENVMTEFLREGFNTFVCKFCERPYAYKEIWS